MTTVHRICKHGVVEYPYSLDPFAHVVVTTLDGRRIAMHPVCAFKRAIEEAVRCANYPRNWTAQVELRCWTLREVFQMLGIDPHSLNITRGEVIAVFRSALAESDDYLTCREAREQLLKMGETL